MGFRPVAPSSRCGISGFLRLQGSLFNARLRSAKAERNPGGSWLHEYWVYFGREHAGMILPPQQQAGPDCRVHENQTETLVYIRQVIDPY